MSRPSEPGYYEIKWPGGNTQIEEIDASGWMKREAVYVSDWDALEHCTFTRLVPEHPATRPEGVEDAIKYLKKYETSPQGISRLNRLVDYLERLEARPGVTGDDGPGPGLGIVSMWRHWLNKQPVSGAPEFPPYLKLEQLIDAEFARLALTPPIVAERT